MLKLEPFPSALLDKREEGKGLGGNDVRESLQCLCVVFLKCLILSAKFV